MTKRMPTAQAMAKKSPPFKLHGRIELEADVCEEMHGAKLYAKAAAGDYGDVSMRTIATTINRAQRPDSDQLAQFKAQKA